MNTLTPGELAPGLYYATPDEVPELLETGEHLDLTDFRNACLDIGVAPQNASRTFGTTVVYLARDMGHSPTWELFYATSWISGNPNHGIRDQLLVGTQRLATLVDDHENNGFDVPPRIFTPKNWRIIRAVVRDEFEVSFERNEGETNSHFQLKDSLDFPEVLLS